MSNVNIRRAVENMFRTFGVLFCCAMLTGVTACAEAQQPPPVRVAEAPVIVAPTQQAPPPPVVTAPAQPSLPKTAAPVVAKAAPPPAAQEPAPTAAPSKAKERMTDAAVAAAIVAASIALYKSSSGGPCACPYDRARNGSSCGKRSAHDRSGGYDVTCYPHEVTAGMISGWRKAKGK